MNTNTAERFASLNKLYHDKRVDMNKLELIKAIRETCNEIVEQDQSARIYDLESALAFWKNEAKQLEIKCITLETRAAEIKNLLNGAYDDRKR